MIRSFKLFEVLDHQVAVCWLGLQPRDPELVYSSDVYTIALRAFHGDRERQAYISFSDKETALKLLREGDDVLLRRCQTFVEGL